MKKIQSLFALLLFAFFLTFVTPAFAEPKDPKTGEIWICPSVSLNNPNGMWVMGAHGAYYIIKPGTASPNWPMILNPTHNLEMHASHVEDQAQVNAGWGLYHKLVSYPNLDTTETGMVVVLLDDAIDEFFPTYFPGLDISGMAPMKMINVEPSDSPLWVLGDPNAMVIGTLYANIPLASAVFW